VDQRASPVGKRPERLVARAQRRRLDEIITGSVTAPSMARRERCTVRQINLTLSLAFLAPQLVKAAVEGRVPRGINIERPRHPEPNWAKQFLDLGLNPN
jgi:hypothetical protein